MRGRWRPKVRAPSPLPAPTGARGIAAIELAAVIAVTLLMVALAVSSYRTHTVRRQVGESLAAVVPLQELVRKAFDGTGVPPASERDVPGSWAAMPPLRAIEAVTIKHGAIEIRFGNDADTSLRGRVLDVTPFETTEGQVVWLCGDAPAEVGLYPLGFFGGTNLPTGLQTTVDPRYLPAECR